MNLEQTIESAEKIAEDMAKLVVSLDNNGIQLDSHDSFYTGYVMGMLRKLAKSLREQ